MNDDSNIFRIKYETDNEMQIDVSNFANALLAIEDEYKSFLSSHNIKAENTSLKIVNIERGSIITDIVATMLPICDNIANVVSATKFIINFCTLITRFRDNSDPKTDIPIKTLKNINSVVTPVANNESTQLNISNPITLINYGTINFSDASNIYDATKSIIENQDLPSEIFQENVSMTLHQGRKGKSKTGNMVIVDSISSKPVKATFASDDIKQKILYPQKGNPFEKTYIVDVYVTYKSGTPKLYNVLKLYKSKKIPTPRNRQLHFNV